MELKKNEMFLMLTLRNLLDKLQKKLDVCFTFENKDLHRGTHEGLTTINVLLTEEYGTETIPSELEAAVIIAAAIDLLTPQVLFFRNKGDLDTSINIEEVIDRFNQWLIEEVKKKPTVYMQ